MKGLKPMNDESLILPALTVYQHWASLLIWGEKEYETRYRPCPLKKGSKLVIHAGKVWDKDTARICQTEPFQRVFAKHGITNPETQLPRGKALGVVIYQGSIQTEILRDEIFPDERAFGNYQDRRYGWKMEVEQVFTTPFSVRGEQGIFRIDITPGLLAVPPAPPPAKPKRPEQPEGQEALFWSDDIYQTTGNTANDEYIYQKHMEYIREIDAKWRAIRATKKDTGTA